MPEELPTIDETQAELEALSDDELRTTFKLLLNEVAVKTLPLLLDAAVTAGTVSDSLRLGDENPGAAEAISRLAQEALVSMSKALDEIHYSLTTPILFLTDELVRRDLLGQEERDAFEVELQGTQYQELVRSVEALTDERS